MVQLILIGIAAMLASGNYWGHIPWAYNIHPALSGAIGILTFLLRPGNNVLVTHDLTAHRLLAALAIQLRGGAPPPPEERLPLRGTKPPPEKELTDHRNEDLNAYNYDK